MTRAAYFATMTALSMALQSSFIQKAGAESMRDHASRLLGDAATRLLPASDPRSAAAHQPGCDDVFSPLTVAEPVATSTDLAALAQAAPLKQCAAIDLSPIGVVGVGHLDPSPESSHGKGLDQYVLFEAPPFDHSTQPWYVLFATRVRHDRARRDVLRYMSIVDPSDCWVVDTVHVSFQSLNEPAPPTKQLPFMAKRGGIALAGYILLDSSRTARGVPKSVHFVPLGGAGALNTCGLNWTSEAE